MTKALMVLNFFDEDEDADTGGVCAVGEAMVGDGGRAEAGIAGVLFPSAQCAAPGR